MTQKRYETFISHFGEGIPEKLKVFIREEVLPHSRYLFVKRVTPSIQRGYCTYCQSDYMIQSASSLKHNEETQCEKCHSLVTVKQSGRGRGKMLDKAYVVWYEKSISMSDAITATGYNVDMDYRADMKGVTTFTPVARYVFEMGKVSMMHRHYGYYGFSHRTNMFGEGWSFARNPFSMVGKSSYTGNSAQSLESIREAAKDTTFAYSEWQKYTQDNRDLIYFFTVFSKHPFIEYLTKMGMIGLVDSMIHKRDMYYTINYRGKTMEKILGLTKQEMKQWRSSEVPMTPIILKTYKWFRENGALISWEMASSAGHLLEGTYYSTRLEYIQQFLPLERIVRYAESQMRKDPRRNRSITDTIVSWKDYLDECQELQMDLLEEKVLLPNNLYKAHQKTTRAVKIKKDEVVNQRIMNLQPSLLGFIFEKNGLLIRPAISSIELFDEGKALDHCVGRYAESYSKGKITIMVIRRTSEVDKPFYTLELDMETLFVTQCRGLRNRDMTDEVRGFVEAWQAEKLTKKKVERKVAI